MVEFSPSVPGETEGIIRSLQESYTANGPGAAYGGAVGGDTNGVGTPVYVEADDEEKPTYYSGERTYNYEINEIKTRIEKAEGSVKDLSVAVLINNNVKGIEEYADTIAELVSKAIGVSEEYVSVAMIPFFGSQGVPVTPVEPPAQAAGSPLPYVLLGVLLILMLAAVTAALLMSRRKRLALAYAGGPSVDVALTGDDVPPEEDEEEDFDISEMMHKRSSETEKVEELMDRYPEIVAQILRAWLTED
jgi:flagellar M-ring protein FliF